MPGNSLFRLAPTGSLSVALIVQPSVPIDGECGNTSLDRKHVCEFGVVITDIEPFMFLLMQQHHARKLVVSIGTDGQP